MQSPPRFAFSDFPSSFLPRENIFYHILFNRLGAQLVDNPSDADILIYCVFGDTHKQFNGLKIFCTGESAMPKWDECDYALTFLRDNILYPECHYRLPLWMFYSYAYPSKKIEQFPLSPEDILKRHHKFCNFVYSNGNPKERIHFFHLLSQYKRIDSSGSLLNNTGVFTRDKIDFCSRYKFTIAFENYPSRGYVTEKLSDALAAGSLPIYWGAPDVTMDFNPTRFINVRDFRDFREIALYVKHLDTHDDEYLDYFKQPLFRKDQTGVDRRMDELTFFLKKALDQKSTRPRHELIPNLVGPVCHGYTFMPRYDDGKDWNQSGLTTPTSTPTSRPPIKIAVCISSYKRLEDLQRQILCMMHQSYPHLHVFVAVKGVSSLAIKKILFPYIQEFIGSSRLTFRIFPNKNQISNFLDTIRNENFSQYDLFVKIDDDDFYSPNYIENIAKFHETLPDGYSSCYLTNSQTIYKSIGNNILGETIYGTSGSAHVLSYSVVKELFACEENHSRLKAALKRTKNQTGFDDIRNAEDQLMITLMAEYGCGNITTYLEANGITNHMIQQKGNTSTIRGGLIPNEIFQGMDARMINSQHDETLIDIYHPHWKDNMLLFKGKATSLARKARPAIILQFTETHLTLYWKEWGAETFVKTDDGVYSFESKSHLCPVEEKAVEEAIIPIIHPSWSDNLIISDKRGHRTQCNDYCDILELTENEVRVDWDHWGEETFRLMGDGKYWFSTYTFRLPDSEDVEEWVIDLFDRPGKYWLHSTGRPVIQIRYSEWDIFLHLDRIQSDVHNFLLKTPSARRILLVGLCKDSLGALSLAQMIKTRHPSIQVGVLGCPWMGNITTPESRRGTFWPPQVAIRYENGIYNDEFSRWGDPMIFFQQMEQEKKDVRGYAFYSINDGFPQDKDNTMRLSRYMDIVYECLRPNQWDGTDIHLHMTSFIRKHSDIFRMIINQCFLNLSQPRSDQTKFTITIDNLVIPDANKNARG